MNYIKAVKFILVLFSFSMSTQLHAGSFCVVESNPESTLQQTDIRSEEYPSNAEAGHNVVSSEKKVCLDTSDEMMDYLGVVSNQKSLKTGEDDHDICTEINCITTFPHLSASRISLEYCEELVDTEASILVFERLSDGRYQLVQNFSLRSEQCPHRW